MNTNQENKIFEVIGRLYFNSILSDEQIQNLNSQVSKLQQQAVVKAQTKNGEKLDSMFIDRSKIQNVSAPE